MTYHVDLSTALRAHFDDSWLHFQPEWWKQRRVPWAGKGKVPNALMLHHTAACNGNAHGANASVISFIQNHYEVPAANFTLDRDGSLYIHSAYAVWNAGLGSFKGKKPWNTLGIPDDMGNDYMLGVEIMSKGLVKDFTAAQKDSLGYLMRALEDASGWEYPNGFHTELRRPRHRDWTTRKIDILYTQAEVNAWL